MDVFLLSIGRNRFELYSEPPEEPIVPPARSAGRLRRWLHTASVKWHDMVEAAREGRAKGRIAQGRDRIVCHLAERIAEQRTLWSLVDKSSATLRYPSTLDDTEARETLDRVLGVARRRHAWWMGIDLLVFLGSAVLAPVPGPNLIAYYVAFRVIGHLQSWRGARRANRVEWIFASDTTLSELAALADQPCEARRSRVNAIAVRLKLQRLPKFFERVAV